MMDNAYGNYEDGAWPVGEADQGIETPPAIGTDERRMHVRAYNYWVSLLGDRSFPSIEDLEPQDLADFGPNSVLLDFTSNVEDPTIQFLGASLRLECGLDAGTRSISQVPTRSLLSRLTDHYLQIIANRAPVGFEAEFVNHRGNNTMYRGILMPFSTDDDNIDFVYGVINWKEVAEPALVTQISEEIARSYHAETRVTDSGWADGPGGGNPGGERQASRQLALPSAIDDPQDLLELELDMALPTGSDAGLGDHLAAARAYAELASEADGRSRAALYRALGSAWDFALFARQYPQDYAEILEDSGLKVQQRAPLTAIVKLVFGTDYDKKRLTEYAAVLEHADRRGIAAGGLLVWLEAVDGGIKAVVKAERAARRGEQAQPAPRKSRPTAPAMLANHRTVAVLDLEAGDQEFVVLLGCRNEEGKISLLAPVGADDALLGRMIKAIEG